MIYFLFAITARVICAAEMHLVSFFNFSIILFLQKIRHARYTLVCNTLYTTSGGSVSVDTNTESDVRRKWRAVSNRATASRILQETHFLGVEKCLADRPEFWAWEESTPTKAMVWLLEHVHGKCYEAWTRSINRKFYLEDLQDPGPFSFVPWPSADWENLREMQMQMQMKLQAVSTSRTICMSVFLTI